MANFTREIINNEPPVTTTTSSYSSDDSDDSDNSGVAAAATNVDEYTTSNEVYVQNVESTPSTSKVHKKRQRLDVYPVSYQHIPKKGKFYK